MDLYRIVKHDELYPHKKDVRYGTKIRASAVVKAAREINEARRQGAEWFKKNRGGDGSVKLITVTIERAPAGEFTDVTAEFMKEGE